MEREIIFYGKYAVYQKAEKGEKDFPIAAFLMKEDAERYLFERKENGEKYYYIIPIIPEIILQI